METGVLPETTAWEQLRGYIAAQPTQPLPDSLSLPDASPGYPAGGDPLLRELRAATLAPEDADEDADEDGGSDDETFAGTVPPPNDDTAMLRAIVDRFERNPMVDRVARLRTPGGLFPLVAAILFFLFAIVPVNAAGDTRLLLIWRALTGGVFLPLSAAHALRDAEIGRIITDNEEAAQVAQAAGKAASAASQVINEAGGIVSAAQAGWQTFWDTSAGGAITIISDKLGGGG